MVNIHRCTISIWLCRPVIQCGRSKTGRSTRNRSNWSIRVRECKKYLRCDYWEKQRAIYQTTAKYNRNSRGIFPCIVSFTDNPAIILIFKCKNENTFSGRSFQTNDANDIYTNNSKWTLMWSLYDVRGLRN